MGGRTASSPVRAASASTRRESAALSLDERRCLVERSADAASSRAGADGRVVRVGHEEPWNGATPTRQRWPRPSPAALAGRRRGPRSDDASICRCQVTFARACCFGHGNACDKGDRCRSSIKNRSRRARRALTGRGAASAAFAPASQTLAADILEMCDEEGSILISNLPKARRPRLLTSRLRRRSDRAEAVDTNSHFAQACRRRGVKLQPADYVPQIAVRGHTWRRTTRAAAGGRARRAVGRAWTTGIAQADKET